MRNMLAPYSFRMKESAGKIKFSREPSPSRHGFYSYKSQRTIDIVATLPSDLTRNNIKVGDSSRKGPI
jgi:hypothetical protein